VNPEPAQPSVENRFWDAAAWVVLLIGLALAAASIAGDWFDRFGTVIAVPLYAAMVGGLGMVVLRIRGDVGRVRRLRQSLSTEPAGVARTAASRLRGTAFFGALASVMFFSVCGAGAGGSSPNSPSPAPPGPPGALSGSPSRIVVGAAVDGAHFWPVAGPMLGLLVAAFVLPVLALLLVGRVSPRRLAFGIGAAGFALLLAEFGLAFYWLPTGCYGPFPGQCGAAVSGLSVLYALGWPPLLATFLGLVADAQKAP
jgi:hypothetical protein